MMIKNNHEQSSSKHNFNVFHLEDYLQKHEFTARYSFCCSDAETWAMSDIVAMADDNERDLWENLQLGYTWVQGRADLREYIAKDMYKNVSPSDILCAAGAEEGIFIALSVLCRDSHAIVLGPCYQSLYEVPKSVAKDVTLIDLLEENEWKPDLDAIKAAIRPDTKVLIMNYPHNPTGQVLSEHELQDIVNLCKQHDLWLFSDEVYNGLGEKMAAAVDLYDKGVSLGVMSKSFGLPGLRIGWVVCKDKDMLKHMEQLKHYTSICNSAPSEILAMIAISNKDRIFARNNEIIIENMRLIDDFMSKNEDKFSWVRPKAGCVGFIRYKQGSANDFCAKILRDYGVLTLPPYVFMCTGEYFRIGYGKKCTAESLGVLAMNL